MYMGCHVTWVDVLIDKESETIGLRKNVVNLENRKKKN